MLYEGLDLNFVDKSFDEFGTHLFEGNLFYGSDKFGQVVLDYIYASEPSLSQYFSLFELLEEGELFLFVENLGSFGFLDRYVTVGRS